MVRLLDILRSFDGVRFFSLSNSINRNKDALLKIQNSQIYGFLDRSNKNGAINLADVCLTLTMP